MDVFSHPAFDAHEQVIFVADDDADLRGIIALHSTALGPAAGGCRMYPYPSVDDALDDVLRLSRGMTMKNAVAGLPLGGGKCVVIADPASSDKRTRLRAMARQVARLNGRYWTAIDVGVSPDDIDVMAEECEFVFTRASDFREDFPPAHFTALGGFAALRAVATWLRGEEDMRGLRVAVQGVGQTGFDLIAQLVERGATVLAADVDESAIARAADTHGVTPVAPEAIHAQDVDVFVPCALGGVLNDETIPELGCRAIAGLANNQLRRAEHDRVLFERGIAYAPDFIVNAGGVIGCSTVVFGEPDEAESLRRIEGIRDTTLAVLERSREEGVPTEAVAESMARERIASAAKD